MFLIKDFLDGEEAGGTGRDTRVKIRSRQQARVSRVAVLRDLCLSADRRTQVSESYRVRSADSTGLNDEFTKFE